LPLENSGRHCGGKSAKTSQRGSSAKYCRGGGGEKAFQRGSGKRLCRGQAENFAAEKWKAEKRFAAGKQQKIFPAGKDSAPRSIVNFGAGSNSKKRALRMTHPSGRHKGARKASGKN
jgi:hypothetical protein